MISRSTRHHTSQRPFIYRVVFGLVYTKWLVAVMFGFFLLHPAVPVFAADPEVADAPQVSEPELKPQEDAAPEPEVVDTEPVEITSETPEELEVVIETPEVITDTSPSQETTEESIPTSEPLPAEPTENEISETPDITDVGTVVDTEVEHGTSTASSSEVALPDAETATSTIEVPEVVTPPLVEEFPTVEPVPDPVMEEEEEGIQASTTEKEIIYIMDSATSDANRHTFSTDECVSVGGGSYYCSKADTNAAALTEDAVYAAPDASGDHEIYLRQDGQIIEITKNNYDDRSPYFDEAAGEIVFHRLIDGRYQIIRYDLDAKDEIQLTFTPENSMEPTQAGGITVWQEWVSDNWEIVALIDGEVRFLSDNIHNDVAPSIKDEYVMWHTMDATGQKLLSVYEIETGLTSHIADPDGGQVSNPRFVLVYDTIFDNGDRVTKTYDPETGAIEPISSKPWERPTIPDPEPGGETGAIINLKPSTRDDSADEGELIGAQQPPLAKDDVATSTSPLTEPGLEIDLSASTTEPLILSDLDLIVEPFTGSSSAHSIDSATSSDNVE